jgi:flagellar basal body-associated protein FliL
MHNRANNAITKVAGSAVGAESRLMKTKKLLAIVAMVFCVALMGVLAGCGSTDQAASSSSSDGASANREYMSNANTIIEQLQDNLNDFSDAVSDDNLVSMKAAAKKAYQNIDSFKQLKPTDTLKPVHNEYVKGCDDLKDALEQYIDLFSDQKKSKLTDQQYKDRLKKIQDKYNSGMDHLKEGDKKATSL